MTEPKLGANMKLPVTRSGTNARLAALHIGVCAALVGAPAFAQNYPARERTRRRRSKSGRDAQS